jgi:ArsR family transcriptional regulator, lead/cadmium/zinc/bismuth-responsive transcriptional repressor
MKGLAKNLAKGEGRKAKEKPLELDCEIRELHPEAVVKARAAIPDLACVDDASTLLKMIADPTRLRILSALTATELCVCDIAASVGLSESASSHQLRLLREHRLVSYRKEGRVVYYRLNDAHVTDMISSALEHARETQA